MRARTRRYLATVAVQAAFLVLALVHAPAAEAHGGVTVGPYEIEVAWQIEPAVVGVSNAVQVSIMDAATLEPVTDVAPGALNVTIAPVGSDSSTLSLTPAGAGTYVATFVPAVSGAYQFRVAGSVHETAVDFTVGNSVDASGTEQEGAGLDPVLLVGGVAILAVIVAMAFVFVRARPTPAPAVRRAAIPSKRRARRGPPGP